MAGQVHDVFSGTIDEEIARRQLESRAAGTKALGTWHATRTIQECREACGGAGYLAENRFAALKADTDVFTTFEGDNHVLLQLVAKGLLTDYSSGFEEMDQLGMVRFVAELGVETIIEKTGVHKLLERIKDVLPGGDDGWDQEAGLLDPDYQLAMLRFREEHMLAGVARRLKRGIDQGMNPGEVFSRVQDHVIGSGPRPHGAPGARGVRREGSRRCPTATTRSPCRLLCDLHALRGHRGRPGMVHGARRLTSQRSKAISREVNRLCRKIRPLAGDLVDALGVPHAMLRSPDLVGTGGVSRLAVVLPGRALSRSPVRPSPSVAAAAAGSGYDVRAVSWTLDALPDDPDRLRRRAARALRRPTGCDLLVAKSLGTLRRVVRRRSGDGPRSG